MTALTTPRLELWGGHECTLNRVRSTYFDQSERSGHPVRPDTLERLSALGISRLRFPILWEKGVTDDAIATVEAMRRHAISPILGLIHHGSGPPNTDLLADDFAAGLARHAEAVASRLPWVTHWTPVNEPLTTARFAALYGLWYPHVQDERSFWLALLNQIDASRLSMRAIRTINPAALLVQTEDLGRTLSTPAMALQAEYDNQRRWMTWDLLAGRVDPNHALWTRLVAFGFEARLRDMVEAPCPADVIGINHYLTSDRFLDERSELHPAHTHGCSPVGRFADIAAVRAVDRPCDSFARAIGEAWTRYQCPIAMTEVHNACTREEQMRWFNHAWQAAQTAQREGIDVRAVTAWSLFGAFDWDSLLTRFDDRYECGVWDMRAPEPRSTAMTDMLRELARGQEPSHPTLPGRGWWQRDIRRASEAFFSDRDSIAPPKIDDRPKLLIIGSTGTLGQALVRACEHRDLAYVATDRKRVSLDSRLSIAHALDDVSPWAVINAAGWVRVDDAEHEPDGCMRDNRDGSLALADECRRRDIPYVTFSSDLVFDGRIDRDYRESDLPAPLNIYGHSKADADRALLASNAKVLVIRTAAFFASSDPYNFAAQLAGALTADKQFAAADDVTVSPTYVPDLVDTVLDLVIDGEQGLWHLTNATGLTWSAFGVRLARRLDLDPSLVVPVPSARMGWVARRPRRAAMTSERGLLLPSLDHAIDRFAEAHTLRRRRR